jgi:hypothetical protein
MAEGAVCEQCIPTLGIAAFSGPHRSGEHHLGVRFGDWRYSVTIDEEARHDVIEVLAGRSGVALVYGDFNQLWGCSNCGQVTDTIHRLQRGSIAVETMRLGAA